MSEKPDTGKKRRFLKKAVLALALVFFLSAVILAAAVALAPTVISSDWVRTRIEKLAADNLGRAVAIDDIDCSWSKGVRLTGIRLADDPAFSDQPLFYLKSASADLSLKNIFKKHVGFTVSSDGAEIRLVRDKSGLTNIEKLLSELAPAQEAETAPEPVEAQPPAVALPVNVQGKIHLDGISIQVADRMTGKTLSASDASFRLEIPDLATAPVTLDLSAGLELDGRKLPPPAMTATVKNLFDADGNLDPARLFLDLTASLPGFRMAVRADLARQGVSAEADVTPARIMAAAAPFLPPDMADTAADGTIAFRAEASGDPAKRISFDATLSGEDLAMAGGPLKEARIGPVFFRMAHKGDFNVETSRLTVSDGRLTFFKNSDIQWRGVISNLTNASPVADLSFGPMTLDLSEMLSAFSEMVPEDIALADPERDGRIAMTIANASYKGGLASGKGEAGLHDVHFTLPGVDMTQGADVISAKKISVDLPNLDVSLTDLAPASVELALAFKADALGIAGENPLSVTGFHLPKLTLRAVMAEGGEIAPECIEAEGYLALAGVSQGGAEGIQVKGINVNDFSLDVRNVSPAFDHVENAAFKASLNVGNIFAPGQDRISVKDLDISAVRLEASGIGVARTSIDRLGLGAALNIGNLTVEGAQNMALEGFQLASFTLDAEKVRMSDAAPFGLTTAAVIKEGLRIQKIELPGLALVFGLEQSVDLTAQLSETSAADVRLDSFIASAEHMEVQDKSVGTLETPLEMNMNIPTVRVTKLEPLQADVDGVNVALALGELLRVKLDAAARNLGFAGFSAKGEALVNLGMIPAGVLEKTVGKGKVSGKTALTWDVAGKRPDDAALERLSSLPADFDFKKDMAFLARCDLACRLTDIGLDMRLQGEERVEIARISTPGALRYEYDRNKLEGRVSGDIVISGVAEAPGAGRFSDPLNLKLSFSAVHDDLQTLQAEQAMTVAPFNISETFSMSLYGLDKALAKGGPPSGAWLQHIGGKIGGGVQISEKPDLKMLTSDLDLSGDVDAGFSADITPGEAVKATCRADVSDMDLYLKDTADVKGLNARIALEKDFDIVLPDHLKGTASYAGSGRRLSEDVLSADAALPATAAGRSAVGMYMGTMQKRLGTRHAISFASADVKAAPVPLSLTDAAVDFHLNAGLPQADHFQMNLLGGTLMGALRFFKRAAGFAVQLNLSFSGLDTARLFPDDAFLKEKQDAEISGQITLTAPLTTRMQTMLQQIEVELNFTHIGARSLERVLYALDPYESDEAIVELRGLLRTGTPRWIRVSVKNGNLSLDGEVEAKGVRVSIPKVDRLNIANISGLEVYEPDLAALGPAVDALNLLSATAILIDKNGNMTMGDDPK